MKYRSWLAVPGTSPLLDTALETGADAVVVDLQAAGSTEARTAARQAATTFLAAHRANLLEQRRMARWVRIHDLASGSAWRDDLLAVLPNAPDGIVLPAAAGPDAVRQLAADLYELEQTCGIPANSTRILPIVGETPGSTMTIADYVHNPHQRLFGLAWSAQGLARALGAARVRTTDGQWSGGAPLVRAHVLLAAHAAGLLALESAAPVGEDAAALARAAFEDGFSGMIGSDANQIAAINAAFASPGEDSSGRASGTLRPKFDSVRDPGTASRPAKVQALAGGPVLRPA